MAVAMKMSSTLSVALCVLLLTLTLASVTADQQDPTGYCFRHRTPIGKRGKCRLRIQAPANSTAVVDAAGCCTLLGGVGWSLKSNGKRCVAACPESSSRPLDPLPMESLMETLEAQAVESPSNDTSMWSEWSDWSNCSAPCGGGNMTRTRVCQGGIHCLGPVMETRPCHTNALACLASSGWSGWSVWSLCDPLETCATKTRSRTCMRSTRPCQGRSSMTRFCIPGESCLVDGGWSVWSDWSECSSTCGLGTRYRMRECNSPAPAYGGVQCPGAFLDLSLCTVEC